jgi:eukaryotic-like serine/threonine-protein kinase
VSVAWGKSSARDTRLKRQVALKVLPQSVSTEVERLARFEREAKTLASLNHPNIAQIYGLEEYGRTHALVMKFVDGEDLAQKICPEPIALDEALVIARQLTEALEATHDQRIIQRI